MKLYYVIIILFSSVKIYAQTTKIQFEDFTLEIVGVDLLFEDSRSEPFSTDVEVDIAFPQSIEFEKSLIKLSESKLGQLKIEMCLETSMILMDEGPHCDLINWKHYTSEWSALSSIEGNTFKANSYSKQERERFPNTNLNEMVKAVKAQCPTWVERAKAIKSFHEVIVGVSRYFLRITGTDKTGNMVTKILIFNVPMGC